MPPSGPSLVRRAAALAALAFLLPVAVAAQTSQDPPAPDPDAPATFTETVVVTTPLPGVELPARRVPGPYRRRRTVTSTTAGRWTYPTS